MKSRDWWVTLCNVIDAKDTQTFLSYLATDCEFRFANGPAAVGHVAIGAAVDGFWASIRGSRHEVTHVWGDSDSAVCEGWCTYTRHDGSTITLPFVDVLRFRDGLAHQYCIYMDVTPLYAPASAGV
jgi:ketosteroid isomerase-like protein